MAPAAVVATVEALALRDVIEVGGMDQKGGWLYFTASPDDATRQYLYRSALRRPGAPERVTPARSPGKHTYDIAPDGGFAFHTFSTRDRPPVTELVSLPAHQTLRMLETNAAVAAATAPWMQPRPTFGRRRRRRHAGRLDAGRLGSTPPEVAAAHVRYMSLLAPRSRRLARGPRVLPPRWRMRASSRRHNADAGVRAGPGERSSTGVGVLVAEQAAARSARFLSQRSYLTPTVASWGRDGRLDDAQPDVPLARALQGRRGRGAGSRPDALRHDLPGAVHGPAAGQRGGVQSGLADFICGGSRGNCSSSMERRRQRDSRGPSASSTG
jgi:hypothetical protein